MVDVSRSDVRRAPHDIMRGLTEGERIRLSTEAEAEMGKRSLYYLCKYILGYEKLNTKFHLPLCRFYDVHVDDIQLHLHPRGHYKTTIITVGGTIKLTLLHPNIRQVIICNTVTNAQMILNEAKQHFIHNDKFRDLYPEHAPRGKREEGTSDAFTTPARTKPWIRMATMEAAGIDRALVSRHFDIAHMDDIVDDKNTATAELRTKTMENYNTTLSVVDGKTKLKMPWHHIVGTRWHLDDAYSHILADYKKHKKFKVLITQAYTRKMDKNGVENTEYLFPEEFPPEHLEFMEVRQKEKFSALYMNDPVPAGDRALDPSLIQFYTLQDEGWPPPMNKVITVDPASTDETTRGDPTVITTAGMDKDSNIYVLEVLRGWWNPDDIVEEIIGAAKRWKVRNIGIEAVAFQKWLCFYVEKRRRELAVYFKVTPIKRDIGVKKEKRLQRIVPEHRSCRIYFRKDEPELEHILREYKEFPKGRYDDFLDTLCDAIEMLRPVATIKKMTDGYRLPPQITGSRIPFQTGYSTRVL
uniref:Putative terminase n=1 Tax=viral metagenome TaxID=1070528 RepID=A0A6M3LA10_9ZZZZ